MWENPQRFQGNYRESSLARHGVLPIQPLLPTEEMGGLGEAALALRWCPLPADARLPAASLVAEARAGQSMVPRATVLHGWPRAMGLSAGQ